MRPKDKRASAKHLVSKYKATKARACRLLGLSLSTMDYKDHLKNDEPIRKKLRELANNHKRFGHPRLFVFLKRDLPNVNHKRSRRIYQEMKLQIGRRKRKKLGSRPRLPASTARRANQIWAIDFMFDFVESGRRLKILTVVDEYSKESPGIVVGHSITGQDVTHFLDHLASDKYPKVIRVDQGTEFTSRAMLDWAYKRQIVLEFTRVRKPNQIIESFNSRVRDECLNEQLFYDLGDAREKIDKWHWKYNNINPHSSLGMKSPVEFALEQKNMLAS